jgi:hypothetical protein
MMIKSVGLLLAFGGALLATSPAASAIIIRTSPGPVQPSENVLFQDATGSSPLTTTTNKGTQVTFESNKALLAISGGQARITGADRNLSFLAFYLADRTRGMSEVEFLLTDPNGASHAAASLTFFDQLGIGTTLVNYRLGNGNDWFSAIGTNGSIISRVEIAILSAPLTVSSGGKRRTPAVPTFIEDVRQVRVTGAEIQTAVPEPSTWLMLIAGFGLVGAALRRRVPQPFLA